MSRINTVQYLKNRDRESEFDRLNSRPRSRNSVLEFNSTQKLPRSPSRLNKSGSRCSRSLSSSNSGLYDGVRASRSSFLKSAQKINPIQEGGSDLDRAGSSDEDIKFMKHLREPKPLKTGPSTLQGTSPSPLPSSIRK